MSAIIVCRRQLLPGEPLTDACPGCGHANLAHAGTTECPVCRLIELATPEGRIREARIRGVQIP